MLKDLELRIARLEQTFNSPKTSKRASFLRWAGSGLKAVHSVFPQTMGSNKLAQKILEILSTAIYDGGLDDYQIVKEIEGVAFIVADKAYDPQDQLEDEEVDATVGAVLSGTLEVETEFMVEIQKLLKVRNLQIDLSDRKAMTDLCDALTKNLAMSVIPRMSQTDLIEHFDLESHIEIPYGDYYVTNVALAYDPEIKVQRLTQKGKSLIFTLQETIEAEVEVEPLEDDYNY